MRQECNYFTQDPVNNGFFWISLRDFVDLFDSLDVCRAASWDQIHIKGSFLRQHELPKESDSYGNAHDADKLEYSYVSKYFFGLEVRTRSHVIVGLH